LNIKFSILRDFNFERSLSLSLGPQSSFVPPCKILFRGPWPYARGAPGNYPACPFVKTALMLLNITCEYKCTSLIFQIQSMFLMMSMFWLVVIYTIVQLEEAFFNSYVLQILIKWRNNLQILLLILLHLVLIKYKLNKKLKNKHKRKQEWFNNNCELMRKDVRRLRKKCTKQPL
jgi:hypothetical protein